MNFIVVCWRIFIPLLLGWTSASFLILNSNVMSKKMFEIDGKTYQCKVVPPLNVLK